MTNTTNADVRYLGDKFREYELVRDGQVIATAHLVNVPMDMWSVKRGDRLVGLVRGESAATAQLAKL